MGQSIQIRSVLLGAAVCCALELLFLTLAVGLGLITMSGQAPWFSVTAEVLGVTYFAAALTFSFFIGGWVASRTGVPELKRNAILSGFVTWATVVTLFIFSFGTQAAGLLSTVGTEAGAAINGTAVVFEELERLRPKIITDVHILKGKAVTEIQFAHRPSAEEILQVQKDIQTQVASEAKKPRVKERAGQVVTTAKNLLGGASLGIFGALILAALACMAGALAGRRGVSELKG